MSVHKYLPLCRGEYLKDFKLGVANRYGVPVDNVVFRDAAGTLLDDNLPLASIDYEFLANITEASGVITPWESILCLL